MSKITAEIEVKQGRISDAVKGIARRVENAFAPLKRNQAAFSRLGAALSPVRNVAMGVAGGVAIAASAVLAAGGAMAAGVKSALDLGGRLSDLEAQTGASAGALMVAEQAFANNGVAAEKLGPTINRLQKALAGANEDGDTTDSTFAKLGLSMESLRESTPDQQLRQVGQAIAALEDPTDRTAAAMKIFGKSGGELQALFSNAGAFSEAAAQVGTQAEIMDRNAALFDDISDKLALAGLKVQGFFVGVADYVAPVIQPLLNWFASQDLAQQGKQFGLYIATAIQMITDGSIGSALKDVLQLAALNFVNTISSGINSVISALSNLPGFGSVAKIQIPAVDTSEVEGRIGNAIFNAVDRVEKARGAADSLANKERKTGAGEELNLSPEKSGKEVSISRLFATTAGLFVKDPLLTEARKQSALLEKIEKGISNLRSAPAATAPGALRFT